MPSWDERKRLTNLKRHQMDFVGAEAIWDNPTITREDDIHIISLRRARKYEESYYFAVIDESIPED